MWSLVNFRESDTLPWRRNCLQQTKVEDTIGTKRRSSWLSKLIMQLNSSKENDQSLVSMSSSRQVFEIFTPRCVFNLNRNTPVMLVPNICLYPLSQIGDPAGSSHDPEISPIPNHSQPHLCIRQPVQQCVFGRHVLKGSFTENSNSFISVQPPEHCIHSLTGKRSTF